MEKPQDLGINVSDEVKTKEGFGRVEDALRKGIAGTLQCINEEDKQKVMDAAWSLSKGTTKPVIIVVRAP